MIIKLTDKNTADPVFVNIAEVQYIRPYQGGSSLIFAGRQIDVVQSPEEIWKCVPTSVWATKP